MARGGSRRRDCRRSEGPPEARIGSRPSKATALADHFEKEWSSKQREAIAQAKRDEETQAKLRKDNEDDAIGMLTRMATNGQLTTASLDSWAETLRLDAGPYRTLHAIVTEAPKDAPSDTAVYNRLLTLINTEDPDFYRGDPQAKLARFAGPGGGINPKDYDHLSQRARSIIASRRSLEERAERRAEGEANRAELRANRVASQQMAEQQRATSKAHFDYNEAVKYAQNQLGVKDPFALDDAKGKLWAQFTNDAYVRLHPSNGVRGEDVMAVVRDELVPRLPRPDGRAGRAGCRRDLRAPPVQAGPRARQGAAARGHDGGAPPPGAGALQPAARAVPAAARPAQHLQGQDRRAHPPAATGAGRNRSKQRPAQKAD